MMEKKAGTTEAFTKLFTYSSKVSFALRITPILEKNIVDENSLGQENQKSRNYPS